MPPSRRPRRALKLVPKAKPTIEFDAGLEQACRLAADDIAYELGRQAALEDIERMQSKHTTKAS
jgi:hypothetical protein